MYSDREQRIKTGRPLQCVKIGFTLLFLEFDSVKNSCSGFATYGGRDLGPFSYCETKFFTIRENVLRKVKTFGNVVGLGVTFGIVLVCTVGFCKVYGHGRALLTHFRHCETNLLKKNVFFKSFCYTCRWPPHVRIA